MHECRKIILCSLHYNVFTFLFCLKLLLVESKHVVLKPYSIQKELAVADIYYPPYLCLPPMEVTQKYDLIYSPHKVSSSYYPLSTCAVIIWIYRYQSSRTAQGLCQILQKPNSSEFEGRRHIYRKYSGIISLKSVHNGKWNAIQWTWWI